VIQKQERLLGSIAALQAHNQIGLAAWAAVK
jgi:hypothetical protein